MNKKQEIIKRIAVLTDKQFELFITLYFQRKGFKNDRIQVSKCNS